MQAQTLLSYCPSFTRYCHISKLHALIVHSLSPNIVLPNRHSLMLYCASSNSIALSKLHSLLSYWSSFTPSCHIVQASPLQLSVDCFWCFCSRFYIVSQEFLRLFSLNKFLVNLLIYSLWATRCALCEFG